MKITKEVDYSEVTEILLLLDVETGNDAKHSSSFTRSTQESIIMKAMTQFFHSRSVLVLSLFALLVAGWSRTGSAQSQPNGPCDIFGSTDNGPATPCVAAYSTTRALFASYTGPLYQVQRQSDNRAADIGVLSNGLANAAAQDTYCSGSTCTISKIYDQTSNHNDLTPAPPGVAAAGPGPNGYDLPAVADALPVSLGGQKVYGISISPGMGYRNNATTGIAVNGQPEGVYMVSSSSKLNGNCCFDFGNAETNNRDNGPGHLDAINLFCYGTPCTPLVKLDLEDGLFGSGTVTGIAFVTAMGWNDGQQNYDEYWGNSQSGGLTTSGATALSSGYSPMHQEGGIVLGIGGDNSDGAYGYFFEGVMTRGAPSDAAMNAVQSNIVASEYDTASPTPPSNLVSDAGFELQTSAALSGDWSNGGSGGAGVDFQAGKAHSGSNNGWISSSSSSWSAINHNVLVVPNTHYLASVWVRSSGNFGTNGYFGVDLYSSKVETTFGSTGTYDSGYQQLTVDFNSGSNTQVTLYIGFVNGSASGSWVQVDDAAVISQ